MLNVIVIVIALAVLLAGSITDLKVREVPDWVSYGAIISGLGIRLLWSVGTGNSTHIIEGFTGFVVFLAIALVMYYSGQWGGGDSKVLMGMGALLGLNLSADHIAVGFFINVIFIGALFGLAWMVGLAVKHKKRFKNEFRRMNDLLQFRAARTSIILLSLVFIAAAILMDIPMISNLSILTIGIALPFMFYLILTVKAVEACCMYKKVNPENLVEGDWIAEEISTNGEKITGPEELGVTSEQIKKIKELKMDKVLVKEGVPFIPSFLLALITTLIIGTPVMFLI